MHSESRSTPSLLPSDGGSASLEFVVVGCVLIVPLLYLVIALGAAQSHALGVQSAASSLARAIALAPTQQVADARSHAVLGTTFAEFDIDANDARVVARCVPESIPCPSAGALIVVEVTATVALPYAPPILGLDRAARIPVHATAVHEVPAYGGGP